MGRIAVLRALPGVGDLLCAVPALRAVRAAHPQAHVTLVGLPSSRWFPQRFPELVDDLLVLEGVPGLAEVEADPDAALRFVEAAQSAHFDLALQLHGNGTASNFVLSMLGARHQVSAHVPGQWRPPGTCITYPEDRHEIDRMLAVASAAGCPPVGRTLDLPLTSSERRDAAALTVEARRSPAGYVCLHPGASRPSRCWTVEGFAAVGDGVADRGLGVVVTGSASEHERAQAVVDRMTRPALNLAGQTNLGTLGALFRQSRLVVTNDSGPSHVAAAVRAPSVVVTGSAEPHRWAPLDTDHHRLVTGPTPPSWPTVDAVQQAVLASVDGAALAAVAAP